MVSKDRPRKNKKRWEKRNPGKIYPGAFTHEMLSGTNSPVFGTHPTQETRKKLTEANRGGLKDEDCPIIVPGSRTEQVIIGSLLGDGYINKTGKFREVHCCEQKEIVFELARLLEPFNKLKRNTYTEPKTRKSRHYLIVHKEIKPQYFIDAPKFPIFKELRKLWYPEGKKIVPDEILNKIGPQALAWWYMGDGHYYKNRGYAWISAQGFHIGDIKKLCEILEKMGFSSTKLNKRNMVTLNHADTLKFVELIAEYIMPTMRYKLGPVEFTYKPYNPHHYDPEPIATERMLKETINS